MKREPISKSLRFEVFKRDGFACQYCGAKAPKAVLHADHIQPVAAGGRSRISNLVTACEACNLGKGDREGASPHVDLVAMAQSVCDGVSHRFGQSAGREAFPLVLRVLEGAMKVNFLLPNGEWLIDAQKRWLDEEILQYWCSYEGLLLGLREHIRGAEDCEAREAARG